MSEFEIWSLIEANQADAENQFQFWLATTFAVIIASYTAGHRLTIWARTSIAILYVLATIVFGLRYFNAFDALGYFVSQLRAFDVEPEGGNVISFVRSIVFFGGSLLAVVLICAPGAGSHRRSSHGRRPDTQP
jgi:hypothetical protein